jgi:hypothetical protein
METTGGGGILGRLGEKVLGWVALGLLIFLGIAIWRAGPEWRAAMWSGIWRTTAWVVIAAALPWIARLFIRRIVEVGSNWAGVGLLAALLAINVIAGLLLMTGWPAGFWGWVAALAALAVAGTYNYLVTEYLAEMSGG